MRWSALLACALVACGGRETTDARDVAPCGPDDSAFCGADTGDATADAASDGTGPDEGDTGTDDTGSDDGSGDTGSGDGSGDSGSGDGSGDTGSGDGSGDSGSGDGSGDAGAGDVVPDDIGDGEVADASDPGPRPFSACTVEGSDMVPIPEASGSALVDAPGAARVRILLVADSGNEGAALVLDPSGAQSVGLTLPLGVGAGDDVEGLERGVDGRIYGLTSAGQVRVWTLADVDGGVVATLVEGPYAVSDDPVWACDPRGVNCGPNYEGICLHPAPGAGDCAGWAASKALGELVCLRAVEGRLVVDPSRRIPVTVADQLSGCAFEPVPPFRLLVAGNLYSGSALWEVVGLDNEPVVVPVSQVGAANQETVIVLPDGSFQSFGDTQGAFGDESPRVTFDCAP